MPRMGVTIQVWNVGILLQYLKRFKTWAFFYNVAVAPIPLLRGLHISELVVYQCPDTGQWVAFKQLLSIISGHSSGLVFSSIATQPAIALGVARGSVSICVEACEGSLVTASLGRVVGVVYFNDWTCWSFLDAKSFCFPEPIGNFRRTARSIPNCFALVCLASASLLQLTACQMPLTSSMGRYRNVGSLRIIISTNVINRKIMWKWEVESDSSFKDDNILFAIISSQILLSAHQSWPFYVNFSWSCRHCPRQEWCASSFLIIVCGERGFIDYYCQFTLSVYTHAAKAVSDAHLSLLCLAIYTQVGRPKSGLD